MLVRLWTTAVDPAGKARLVDYANRVSLPVLSSRPGNRGVLFFSEGEEWTTLTLWDTQESIDGLADDPEYSRIVEGIVALDVLGSNQRTVVMPLHGAELGTR